MKFKDNKIPSGWEIRRIEDIAVVNPRRKKLDLKDNTIMNFVPMTSVKEEFAGIDITIKRPFEEIREGYTQFRTGDVLSAKITPCMENGKIAIVPHLDNDYGYGSTEFHILRPKSNINAKWLSYYILQHSFRREARLNMTGSAGQLRVPKKWLSSQVIPVPPIDQQKQIVNKIEQLFSYLDAGGEALERAKANLERYRAAVLKAAVEGKLTEQWRAEQKVAGRKIEPASELLKRILVERKKKWIERELDRWKQRKQKQGWSDEKIQSALPKQKAKIIKKYKEPTRSNISNKLNSEKPCIIPLGWEMVKLDDICNIIMGQSPPSSTYNKQGKGLPFFQGKKEFTDMYPEIRKWCEKPIKIAQKDDILFSVRAPVGPTNITPSECCVGRGLAALSPYSGVISHFILYMIRHFESELAQMGTGTTFKAVSNNVIKNFEISIAPTEEQKQIVLEIEKRFSLADHALFNIINSYKRVANLRQSILKYAFNGSLLNN